MRATRAHKSPCPTGLEEMKGKKNRHCAAVSSCSGDTAQWSCRGLLRFTAHVTVYACKTFVCMCVCVSWDTLYICVCVFQCVVSVL